MRHKWTDDRLVWNPADYGNIQYSYMASNSDTKLWTPDLALRQMNGKMLFPGLDKTLIRLHYTGEIYWSRPGLLDLVHKFDLSSYPFDVQQIQMVVESWSNPTFRLRLSAWDPANMTMSKEPTFYSNKQWLLQKFDYSINKMDYPGLQYDSIKLTFSLTRQAQSIVKMIFVPGIMISSLSVFCYLLPMEGPVRVKFIIQVLLNMVVLTILLTTHLPISRSKILLVDIFQALIILIYSILVYVLCIEKYRTYQIYLSKEFQSIIDKIDIQIEKEKLKQATKTLHSIVRQQTGNQNNQTVAKSSIDTYGVDLALYKKFNNQIIINKFKKILKKLMIFKPNQFDFLMFFIIALTYIIVIIVTIVNISNERNRYE